MKTWLTLGLLAIGAYGVLKLMDAFSAPNYDERFGSY